MKKLTRRGIAFIVLDHTNSEGELQGSKVKSRAMDLGLKLELLEHNEIRIDFHCDRYGREHAAEKFNLIPCFAASEFSYVIKSIDDTVDEDAKKTLVDEDATKTLEQIAGKDIDLVAIFLLKEQGKQNKEVANDLRISPPQVSKKLKQIGRDSSWIQIDSDPNLINKFKEIENKARECLDTWGEGAVLDLIELVSNRAKT